MFIGIRTVLLSGLFFLAGTTASGQDSIRVATFNVNLSEAVDGGMLSTLSSPGDLRANITAEIIQRVNPDIILLNEFDYEPGLAAVNAFRDNYLSVPQNNVAGGTPSAAVAYPFAYVAPSNTGVPSGFDLNNSGTIGGPNDAFGFGEHEGHFGMALLSKYPILESDVRTFQNFLWRDVPGALLPDNMATPEGEDFFSPEELDVLRLSSKSHWDVPIQVGENVVHVLAAHPTPPVFDGPEDLNGRRNHDEIRLWADYITPGAGDYLYDDTESAAAPGGGIDPDAAFVILGDYNADPLDGESVPGAIGQLLDSSRINTSLTPESLGGPEDSAGEGNINDEHLGDPRFDTSDFNSDAPGNLRVDYALPSANLSLLDAGVFWPSYSDPEAALISGVPLPGGLTLASPIRSPIASDHRLVYVDIVVPEPSSLIVLAGAVVLTIRRRVTGHGPTAV
ncbi:MAG: endonuclease/exonuclease/phosphatase family protein [Planctomycetota bacterium]